jgi:hypothetical protein
MSARTDYGGDVNKSKGMLLLGAWAVLDNLLPLLNVRFPNSGLLLAMLGILAGALLILDR